MTENAWVAKLVNSSLWVFLGMLFGRLAGFLRDVVLASQFGVGNEADVAILMLTLPDLLVNILVGGGLSVALIPTFKRYGAGLRAHCLFMQSTVVIALLFSGLAFLLTNLSEPLIRLAAPGFDLQNVISTAPLLHVVLWLIPLTTLAGVSTAYLQANNRFAASAFGTFTFNIVILVGLGYSITSEDPLQKLAFFIVVGGVVRWLLQLLALPRYPISWRCLRWQLIDSELVRRYLHAASAGGLLLFLPVIARAMGSLYGEGGLSLFSYAMKLVTFPLGISVMALSVGIFPLLSQCFARNREECGDMVASGLQIVLLITVAIMLPVVWFADDFARLVFARGAMEPQQVEMIGKLLSLGALALPFQGASSILTATYNAARDTAFILRLNIISVVVFVLAGYWTVTNFGLSALMMSLVAVYGIFSLVQLLALPHRLSVKILGLLWRKRMVHSLTVMILAGAVLLFLWQELHMGTWLNVLGAVLIGVCLLLLGIVASGSHRDLITRLLKRPVQ